MLEGLRFAWAHVRAMRRVCDFVHLQRDRVEVEYQEEYRSTVGALRLCVEPFISEWLDSRFMSNSCSVAGRHGISLHLGEDRMTVHIACTGASFQGFTSAEHDTLVSKLAMDFNIFCKQKNISFRDVSFLFRNTDVHGFDGQRECLSATFQDR